jgi:hypothetical protein
MNLRKQKTIILFSLVLLIVSSFSTTFQPVSASTSAEVSFASTGSILPGPSGQLSTSGPHIVDSNGHIFYLKGAGADHNEWGKGYFTASDVATIKQNGGNVVEIHTVDFSFDVMPTKNVINTAFFTNTLDPLVNLITGQGLYCIISFRDITVRGSTQYMANWMMDGHSYGSAPYSPTTQAQAAKDFYNLGNSGQNENRAIWISAWSWIASHYASNTYVIFSPVNEPMNSLTFTTAERPVYGQYYATFMEQTVDAIRATGAQQLVFIDKPYSASEWSDVKKVNRPNIVWEDHAYVEDGHSFSWWQTFVSQMVNTFVTGFGQPLFIGEYATNPLNRANWQTDMANMATYLNDTSKFSGRQFHSWGMLYGEYDNAAEGNSGALTNSSDNNYLIQTILR